jgi:hypothetical protein
MFETLRQILPEGGQHKGTSPCKAETCKKSTREGKPFCSAHIESAPYVRKILDILAGRALEEEVLEKQRGRIPADGFFYRETLLLLRSKDFTAKGLSRRLDISHHAAERLIAMMDVDKLAKRGATSRGDMTISGLAPRDLSGLPE